MNYTLPDGRIVDLAKVSSISKVRDFGRDSNTIDLHQIGFTIHLERREIVEVLDKYHFCDWAEVKNRLKRLREDMIEKWEEEQMSS